MTFIPADQSQGPGPAQVAKKKQSQRGTQAKRPFKSPLGGPAPRSSAMRIAVPRNRSRGR